MSCPNDSHVHHVPPAFMLFHGYAVIDHSRGVTLLTRDRFVADRVAELINRHGLTDIPDNAAELLTPWPAPTGRPRTLLADIHKLPADPTKDHHR